MAQCENVFAALWLPIHQTNGRRIDGRTGRTDVATDMASLVSRFDDDAKVHGIALAF